MNIGVDAARGMTPPRLQPGIGLRPGEPDHPAAAFVPLLYAALWESVAAHARLGLHVVVDVGMYDAAIADDARRRLAELPVVWVGVRCPSEVLLERRRAAREGYAADAAAVERWQDVHAHVRYDLVVDTSTLTPADCATAIATELGTFRA